MTWTFGNMDDFGKWCRQQEHYRQSTAIAQTAQKRKAYYDGQSSVFREIAEMIENQQIVLEVEDAAVEAREELLEISKQVFFDDVPKLYERIETVLNKLNQCLNIKHFERCLQKRKEAQNAVKSADSGKA